MDQIEPTRSEQKPLLSLKSDYLFRRIFGDAENVDLLCSLLASIVKIPPDEFDEILVIDPELPPDWPTGKRGVLDLKVRTKTGMMIDVEMQLFFAKAFAKRSVYYGSRLLSSQISSGEEYRSLKKVICIAILNWRLNDEPDFHNVYQLRNVASGALFTDIIEFHTIELPKLPSEGDGDFYNWMRLIAAEEEEEMETIAKRGAVFEKAVRKVRYFSADEQTRFLIESYEKAQRDELMRINDAYEEGEAKGRAEGEAKGRAEGEAKGRAEGIAEGEARGREQIVINMLESGMSPEEVTKLSGLSADSVAELDRTRRE